MPKYSDMVRSSVLA